MRANLEVIKDALILLNSTANVKHIKDKVTELPGGKPPHYKCIRSYRETIQAIIEKYCSESSNFKGKRIFYRLDRGQYRLVE